MTDNTEALPPLPPADKFVPYKDGFRAAFFDETLQAYARAALAQRQQVPDEPTLDRESTWWALAMGAAASLEDAANCMRDPDAEKVARGAAAHVRRQCAALTAAPSAQAEPVATVLRGAHVTRDGFHIEWHTEPPMGESKLYAAPPTAQAEPMTPYTLAKSAGLKGAQIMQALARVGYQVTLNQELGWDQIASALAAQAEPQVPLTDEQIDAIVDSGGSKAGPASVWSAYDFARAIERAHGIGQQEGK